MTMTNQCTKKCLNENLSCSNKECRNWINYSDDLNCSVIAAEAHGPMTLEEVAKRLDISLVRVMQIENGALIKMKKRMPQLLNE
jgi:hypothetical protein